MSIETTVIRIKEIAHNRGIKMKNLTSRLGVRDNYFTDCRNKKLEIPEEILKRAAILLDTSMAYLKGETDDPSFSLKAVGMTVLPFQDMETRPVFGHASAGLGVVAQQETLGYEKVDSEYSSDEYFWLQVDGDSMAPMINDKDLVLVERGAPLESGSIMVVIVDDEEGFIKKVSIDDDTLTLHSFNPYYPPMIFGGSELSRIRNVGKVVELKRKF